MQSKAKITKEMIISAGIEIVRMEGAESLNVLRIAAALGCSTKPVMYQYFTVDDLKSDILHTDYIMRTEGDDSMLSIGLYYIRFTT